MAYFIRVDAETEVAYELFAEPIPEPQAGEPQAEAAAEQIQKTSLTPLTCKASPGV